MLAQTNNIDQQALNDYLDAFLRENLPSYIERFVDINQTRLKELSIIERVIRVEEELKHLRALELERHEALLRELDIRFKASQEENNKRFEASQRETDARFEAAQQERNKRFEALLREMDIRFKASQEENNKRFEALQKEMDIRFEAMNTRLESLQTEMNTRFEAVIKEMRTGFDLINTRIESLEKRFNFMQWLIASGIAIMAVLTAIK